jgi:hypothetical protein
VENPCGFKENFKTCNKIIINTLLSHGSRLRFSSPFVRTPYIVACSLGESLSQRLLKSSVALSLNPTALSLNLVASNRTSFYSCTRGSLLSNTRMARWHVTQLYCFHTRVHAMADGSALLLQREFRPSLKRSFTTFIDPQIYCSDTTVRFIMKKIAET